MQLSEDATNESKKPMRNVKFPIGHNAWVADFTASISAADVEREGEEGREEDEVGREDEAFEWEGALEEGSGGRGEEGFGDKGI
mmetsp:Transcript_4833/g.8811  ORF Transcript_4833/g.8811 Transcript_4833/m.8811 type:complete len:84 (+) Transcript_4833:1298-1549(+)